MGVNDPQGRIVLLRTYDNDVMANIALGVLRTNGIPCCLDNELTAEVFGIQLAPFDGIRLMVRECDLATAAALLDSNETGN